LFLRAALAGRAVEARRRDVVVPVLVAAGMQVAVMVQLIAMASPILPEQTRFDGGIDQLVER
jgi:hypothetical protein